MHELWAVGPKHWMMLSLLLFSIGMYGVLTRRNAIGILFGIELMLNASALNFVVFNRYLDVNAVDGALMAIFIIAVAAAEVVVALAIFVSLFKQRKTADVTQMNEMKG